MANWRLAPTLVQLLKEVNALYPLRDKTSDGTLGNASHAASRSDHNPDNRRVVCAVDIDEDLGGSANQKYPKFNSGQPAKEKLLNRLLKAAKAGLLPQLYYVIYEGYIYSRTNDFRPKVYNGPNKHDHHLHVSVYHEAYLADRKAKWFSALGPIKSVANALVGSLYIVDPAKFDNPKSTLFGVSQQGVNKTEHKQGDKIRIARVAYLKGRKYVVTPNNVYYAADYMTKVGK